METKEARTAVIRLASLAGLFGLWALAAFWADDLQTLPYPWTVAYLMWREVVSGEMVEHLTATLLRVLAAFIIAMFVGLLLGLAMGRRSSTNRWLDPWLIVLLNLPALVTIVLCYIWIGLTEVAAIAAVAINKIPMVTVMIREGAKALNRSFDDLGQVYRLHPMQKLRHLILPQLMPHVASAARAGIALIWKIVLVVEFLGRSNGVGFQIHLYFQLFDVGMVLAYAFAFIVIMLSIELLILQPFERYVTRWRRV